MRVDLVALATVLLSQSAVASWIPDLFQSFEGFDVLNTIEKRCDNPCGYYGQVCCAAGQFCYTDGNNQAQCGVSQGTPQQSGQDGQWQYFTTTYVQTDLQTITTTFSSFVPYATVTPTATAQCTYSQGESLCGNMCCHAGQYCQVAGSCVDIPGGSSQYYGGIYTITTVITNTANPGIRPTTVTVFTLTSAGPITGTASYTAAVGTGGAVLSGASSSSGGGGLSGGAIAGIVIGVLIGLVILFLICACFCFKGLIDGLLAIFGLGPRRRKRTEETYIEERHSHRAGGAGRRWWGQPARTEVVEEKKKKESGLGRIAGVAGLLGGLALILGLKRRHDRKDNASASGYGSSAYYYSDYTSDTSPSSVTRTRSRSRSRSRYSRR